MGISTRLIVRMLVSIVVFSFLIVGIALADHSININTADKAALITLNGIGDVKAQAIIDYRATNGPFVKIEDIMKVNGIGTATFNSIKDHITVQGGNSSTSPPPPAQSAAPQKSLSASSASEFVVEGGSDRSVIVDADVQFSVRTNLNKEILNNASFMWNFGDGSAGNGAASVHRFEYPGRYTVVVSGSYDGASATDRFTVIAESAQLAVYTLPDGGVEIKNLAKSDIDLSGWGIQSAGQRFRLPDNSVILSEQTMRISPNTLHFYAGNATTLDYQSGALAFRAGEYFPEITTQATSATPTESLFVLVPNVVSAVEKNPSKMPKQQEVLSYEEEADERLDAEAQQSLATSSQVASVAVIAKGAWKWWTSAFAMVALAGGAVFVSRRFGKKEWNIIEDTSESV